MSITITNKDGTKQEYYLDPMGSTPIAGGMGGGGGSTIASGKPIEVTELPTSLSEEDLGKVYLNTTTGEYYEVKTKSATISYAFGDLIPRVLNYDTSIVPDFPDEEGYSVDYLIWGHNFECVIYANQSVNGGNGIFIYLYDEYETENSYEVCIPIYFDGDDADIESVNQYIDFPITKKGWQGDGRLDLESLLRQYLVDNGCTEEKINIALERLFTKFPLSFIDDPQGIFGAPGYSISANLCNNESIEDAAEKAKGLPIEISELPTELTEEDADKVYLNIITGEYYDVKLDRKSPLKTGQLVPRTIYYDRSISPVVDYENNQMLLYVSEYDTQYGLSCNISTHTFYGFDESIFVNCIICRVRSDNGYGGVSQRIIYVDSDADIETINSILTNWGYESINNVGWQGDGVLNIEETIRDLLSSADVSQEEIETMIEAVMTTCRIHNIDDPQAILHTIQVGPSIETCNKKLLDTKDIEIEKTNQARLDDATAAVKSIVDFLNEKSTTLDLPGVSDMYSAGIGNLLFKNTVITSLNLPDIMELPNCQQCTALESVTLGSSVKGLDTYALYGCTALKSLTIKATTPPHIFGQSLSGVPEDCAIYVPAESLDAYKTAAWWSDRADYIQAIPEV